MDLDLISRTGLYLISRMNLDLISRKGQGQI